MYSRAYSLPLSCCQAFGIGPQAVLDRGYQESSGRLASLGLGQCTRRHASNPIAKGLGAGDECSGKLQKKLDKVQAVC
jgi:hypothetical protein